MLEIEAVRVFPTKRVLDDVKSPLPLKQRNYFESKFTMSIENVY